MDKQPLESIALSLRKIMNNKLRSCIIGLLLIIALGIVINPVNAEATKNGGSGGGGLPNNPYIDGIKNALKLASVAISCPSGYTYCYEQNNIYGNAQAMARVYLSDPYLEGNNLYINYRGDATKFYVYRGLTSWSQVSCGSGGCSGGQEVSSNGRYLIGSAPSTSQPGFVFVAWDYNSYGGYWSWTWAGHGWMQPFNYNLQPPTPTPTAVPTAAPTPVPTQTIYVCSNGQQVTNQASCPTSTPTPIPTTPPAPTYPPIPPVTAVPTPPPITSNPTPVPTPACAKGDIFVNGQCNKVFPGPGIPGFELLFAIAGLIGIYGLNKTRKK
jgi:hypothetical protein